MNRLRVGSYKESMFLLHVFGVEALSLRTTKPKGAWQRTSFKSLSTHIVTAFFTLLIF